MVSYAISPEESLKRDFFFQVDYFVLFRSNLIFKLQTELRKLDPAFFTNLLKNILKLRTSLVLILVDNLAIVIIINCDNRSQIYNFINFFTVFASRESLPMKTFLPELSAWPRKTIISLTKHAKEVFYFK